MSLQEAEEARARSQGGEASTASAATPPHVGPTPAQTTETAIPRAETIAQSTETAAILPESVTQPLHNANDPIIPQVPGDSGSIPTSAATAAAEGGEDEKDALQRAMDMSMGKEQSQDVVMSEEVEGDDVEDDEEAAIARAIAMSLEEAKGEQNEQTK